MTSKDLLVLTPMAATTPEIGLWLGIMRETRAETLKTVAKISDLDAQPAQGHSAGTLLYHIAQVELGWLYNEVLEEVAVKGEAGFPPETWEWFPKHPYDEQGRLVPITGDPLERHLARLSWVRGRLEEVFSSMTLDEFRRVRVMEHETYDVTPEWVLMHLAQHEAHHEGQLAQLK